MSSSSSILAASGAALIPKMPKPKTFNGDKDRFPGWFRHVEMYWLFYDTGTEKQKILITLPL